MLGFFSVRFYTHTFSTRTISWKACDSLNKITRISNPGFSKQDNASDTSQPFCSTVSVTEGWGGSNRSKQTPLLKGATDYIKGVTSNEDQRNLHYYLKTGNHQGSEILVGAQSKYYKLGGIRDVYTETKSEQNLHQGQRGLTEPHVPQNKKSELSKSSTLHIFTYQALYKLNNLTWHLTTPPKTTGQQWVIGEEETLLHSKTYHQFLFVMLLTHQ